jgi:acetyl-CoA C-acetyltransferase
MTRFGEAWNKSFREIGLEAGIAAINDAGITGADVEALYVGNMSSGRFVRQEHVAPIIAESAGLLGKHIPATRVEGADAAGGLALRQGFMDVASGMHDIVVVGGAEKMTDVDDEEVIAIQSMTADQEWEAFFGATYASLFALAARRHMHDYGTTKEQLAHVAVKNHRHGALNPLAQFRSEVKLETVVGAEMVADPLGVFDCAPTSDGAAAIVLAPLDMALSSGNMAVEIVGSGQATDAIALHSRRDLCTFDATVHAARRAYEMAGLSPKDVDVAEVHDCFTISEILAVEDLGFIPKGQGGIAAEQGLTALGGEIPVNTSGGLKARGHPIGATGIAQSVEVVAQLRGKAEKRQVKGATVGLTHNLGGTGGTAVVHLFREALR